MGAEDNQVGFYCFRFEIIEGPFLITATWQEKPARQGQISEETRKYLRAHRGEKRKRKDDDQAKQRVGKKAMTAKPRRKKPKKPVVSLWSRPKGEEWVGQARARVCYCFIYEVSCT